MSEDEFIEAVRSLAARMRTADDPRTPAQSGATLGLMMHDLRAQLMRARPKAVQTLVGIAARCLILAGKLAPQEAARDS